MGNSIYPVCTTLFKTVNFRAIVKVVIPKLHGHALKHHFSHFESIPGTRENYCYLFKPGVDHFYYRKYLCMSCVNCENFKTDPLTGKIKCLREEKTGSWKKGVFKRKKAKDSKDWWLKHLWFENDFNYISYSLLIWQFESFHYRKNGFFLRHFRYPDDLFLDSHVHVLVFQHVNIKIT